MQTDEVLDYLYDHALELALVAVIGILIALLTWVAVVSERQWNAYAAAHHCVQVGTEASSVAIASDGKTAILPEKTIYRCDGGEIQIR